MSHKPRHARRNLLALLFLIAFTLMASCGGSADYKACTENNDLQACNRECARDNREACAKAETIKAGQKK